MRPKLMARTITLSTLVIAGLAGVFPASLVYATGSSASQTFCNPFQSSVLFCDNFILKTRFVNDTPSKPYAKWWKYGFNPENASKYQNNYQNNTLRLNLDTKTTTQSYSNTNISTSEINNFQGNFPFGVNTRAEVRMKYSPTMLANNTGTAKGSAGFLFWDYFVSAVSPEQKDLTKVRDAFGFVWQDTASFPNAGFWIVGVANGVPGEYIPYTNIDLSVYHNYALERREDSIKFFIDNVLVHTIPVNGTTGLYLPNTQKMSTDIWVDNASYILDFSTFTINLDFNKLTQDQFVDIDFVKVTNI